MIVTSIAMIDIEVRRRSLRDHIRAIVARRRHDPGMVHPSSDHPPSLDPDDTVDLPAPSEDNLWRWRRHPQLRKAAQDAAMCETERRARHSAVHGLYAALAGNADDASAWFLQAVSVHDIDLTDLPSFWQMPRAAIESAATAYECVGRFREAAMVQARLRSEFRPRNVVTLRPGHAADEEALEAAAR